jgi:uncharacterized SAM-binding protein YcdF (DUF218 family)
MVLAGLTALWLCRAQVLPPLARFLDVSELPARVDYVLVLGGGADARPFVAAALVHAERAGQVLVPTVKLVPEAELGLTPAEHDLIRRVLLARGISSESIVQLPGEANSTRDEVLALGRFLEDRPEVTVAVVTTTWHTRRARMIFHRVLGEQAARVHFVGAPPDRYDESNWWQSEAGFAAYVTEYAKLLHDWVGR